MTFTSVPPPFRLLFSALTILYLSGCNPGSVPDSDPGDSHLAEAAVFDGELAERLGADEYGMRRFVMAFLKAGPHRDQDAATAAELQRGHMETISRLAEEGKLILAGPFLADTELRGLYLFAVETVEEARLLTETDPAVQAGRLAMDLVPWYGSAALMTVNDTHRLIARRSP
jgi:uncharacterized protein